MASLPGTPTDVPYASFGNPQSLNLYGYVHNNPVTAADPDGHDMQGLPEVQAAVEGSATPGSTVNPTPPDPGNTAEATQKADKQGGQNKAQNTPHNDSKPLPTSGEASIYADRFEGKKTSNGETFHQSGYSAALLPKSRWHAKKLGTKVKLTHDQNSVVVEINDRGAGDKKANSTRTLDLSRAAASTLTGQQINNDKDADRVGLIHLDNIEPVSADTPVGPQPAQPPH